MASGGGDRLRVATAVNLRQKMDALVSDLSHALDESQLPQYHRKRRGFKRRAKLATNLGLSGVRGVLSDDSSSSIGEVLLSQDNKSSIPLTDSDDLSPPAEPRHRAQLLTHHRASSNLVESDSVNENFSPARPHNRSVDTSLCRRRKCKRLALDPDAPSPSTSATAPLPPPPATLLSPPTITKPTGLTPSLSSASLLPGAARKKKVLRQSPETENRYLAISAGKRKRGRERSAEWCAAGGHVSHHHHHHHHRRYGSSSSSHLHHHSIRVHRTSQPSTEDSMEYDYSDDANMEHSSSESSSESETGIYTCDEGREADDEQSDWFAEPDMPGAPNAARQRTPTTRLSWWNDNDLGLSSSAKALFKERYETMSVENQQACRLRFQKLRERLLRREIRAGRRRLRDRKPGFSIISSVNDKVSRFLQIEKEERGGGREGRKRPVPGASVSENDPRQSELRLRPMSDKDHDQLRHLANLYSLSIHSTDDHNAPILTKTRNTITKQRLESDDVVACRSFPGGLPVPLSDLKRRRRTPPPPPSNLTEGSNDSVESVTNSASLPGGAFRPPVPSVSWEDDVVDCCADSLSERLADSEPDPLPSPTSLGLHDCTL